jgi:hypothetical protein
MISRVVFLFALWVGMVCSAYAQSVSVSVADTTHRQDSIKAIQHRGAQHIKTAQDRQKEGAAILQRLQEAKHSPVQWQDGVAVQRVYSERYQNALRDSVRQLLGDRAIPTDLIPKQEVSRETMLDAINQKFQNPKGPPSELTSLSEKKMPELPSVEQMKLPVDDLSTLMPLPGSLVKTKYLQGLDSLRRIRLREENLKLEEETIGTHAKALVFQKKPTFWQRSYFEGILGVVTGKELTLYQASPSLGVHLTDRFSLGAGPIIQVQSNGSSIRAIGGVRTFSKIEFWKRQLYLQAEDAINAYQASREGSSLDTHNILVGGGVLLSVKAPVTLNFCVLYKVNENKTSMSDISPLVFRIGISTVKVDK